MSSAPMKSRLAYATGYEMSQMDDDSGNPYKDKSLAFWWQTGFQAHQLGRPRLFEQEMAALGLDGPSKGL